MRFQGLKRTSGQGAAPIRFVIIGSLFLLALWFGLGSCHHSSSNRVSEISAQDILDTPPKAEGPVLVDVRAPSEYEAGHVPRAINIPVGEMADRLPELGPHREQAIVVYCEQGGRALKAAAILGSAGFPNIRHLKGDMSAWRAAGLPVER